MGTPLHSTVTANIIQALRCGDPHCTCSRNGASEHLLHCPAHADETPSLSLTEQNGKVFGPLPRRLLAGGRARGPTPAWTVGG
jgi:hypothetical protein